MAKRGEHDDYDDAPAEWRYEHPLRAEDSPLVTQYAIGPVDGQVALYGRDDAQWEELHDVLTPAEARELAALLVAAAEAAEAGVGDGDGE